MIIALLLGINSAVQLGWIGNKVDKMETTVGASITTQKSDTLKIK